MIEAFRSSLRAGPDIPAPGGSYPAGDEPTFSETAGATTGRGGLQNRTKAADTIPEFRFRRQAVFYYTVFFLWPAYLFFLPFITERFGFWSFPFFIFPGVYLFTWAGSATAPFGLFTIGWNSSWAWGFWC